MAKSIISCAANPANLELATKEILTLGTDSRSQIGINELTIYGTSSAPRQAIPFGSCTASSPIQRVYDATVAQHVLFLGAQARGMLFGQIHQSYKQIITGLCHHLRIVKKNVRVVLTPSGTDAELLALVFALGDMSRPLCNIVVGPQEIGSGSSIAAAGRYFDSILAHGPSQKKDTPISSRIADLVHVESVPIRDDYGCVRESDDINDVTETLVHRAIKKHECILIHIVAHSKTGIHAPSISTVRKLQQKYPRDITVVVDAAQGRCSRQSLRSALAEGFLVVFTGSKFYGGPSFSGALLVPEHFDSIVRTMPPLPTEFGNCFSRLDFPDKWSLLTSNLPHDYNLGLLLRWVAALESMRSYYSVSEQTRFSILKHFEKVILQESAKYSWFKLDRVMNLHFSVGKERFLELKTTVFPFNMGMITASGQLHHPSNDESKKICEWLNKDISNFATGESIALRKTLASMFHIGQPVSLGNAKQPVLFRIAMGAALVIEAALNQSYGVELNDRLDWLDDQVRKLFIKLDWISRHYVALTN